MGIQVMMCWKGLKIYSMKLNKRNYFTIKNKYISNSKIGDYLKCPNFFFRKHILGNVERKETPAMRIGSAVDVYVTSGVAAFAKKYRMVSRRDKVSPKGVIQLPTAEFEQVIKIGQKVRSTSAFKELKGFKKQQILQHDMDLGMFHGICGIPDWYKIEGDHAIIVDLKTAKTINTVKYHYHCLSFNYYRQAGMYALLLKHNFNIKTFESRHLVVEKDPDGIYNCKTFTLDNDMIWKEMEFIADILEDISKESKFNPNDTSFKDAVVIGARPKSDGEWGVEI